MHIFSCSITGGFCLVSRVQSFSVRLISATGNSVCRCIIISNQLFAGSAHAGLLLPKVCLDGTYLLTLHGYLAVGGGGGGGVGGPHSGGVLG